MVDPVKHPEGVARMPAGRRHGGLDGLGPVVPVDVFPVANRMVAVPEAVARKGPGLMCPWEGAFTAHARNS